jgi:TP901 family phage tail tape measure protein
MSAALQASIRISLLDQFSGPLRGISSGLGRFKQQLGGIKFPSVARFAADLNQAGEAASRVGRTIGAGLKVGVDEFAGFEKQMARVKAVAPELSSEAFGRLRSDAIRWGADTAFSAQEAGKAMENFLARGFTEDQTRALGRMTLDFSVGNDLGLDRASEIIGGVTKAFNQDMAGAAVSTDILSAAAAKSAANAEYLSAAMIKAGPLARQLSMDLSMVAAGASVFAEAQIPAEEGATAFRSILLKLSSFAKPARDAFASLGYGTEQIKQLQGVLSQGDLPGVLQSLGTAMNMKGLSGAGRLETLSQLFGEEMASQASVLIDASVDPNAAVSLQRFHEQFKQVEEETKRGSNYTARMAKLMGDNLTGEIERTGGALSELALRLGEILAPSLREALRGVQELASKVSAFAQANPELAERLVMLTAGLGAAGIAAGGFLYTLSAMTTGLGVVGKALSFTLNSLGTLSKGALGMGRTFLTFTSYLGGASGVLGGIEAAITAVGAALTGPVAGVVALVAAVGLGAYYTLKWAGQLENVTDWFSERFDAVMAGVKGALEFFVGLWTLEWRFLSGVASEVFGFVVGIAELAVGGVISAWRGVREFFGEVFFELGEIAGVVGKLIGDVLGPDAVQWVKDAWQPIGDFFSELWGGIAETFDDILGPLFGKVGKFIDETRAVGRGKLRDTFGSDAKKKRDQGDEQDGPLDKLHAFMGRFASQRDKDNAKGGHLFDLTPNMSRAQEGEKAGPLDYFAESERLMRNALAQAKLPSNLVLPKVKKSGVAPGSDDPEADARYYAAQQAWQESMGDEKVVARYPDGSRDERQADGTVARVQPPKTPAQRKASPELPRVKAPKFAPPLIASADSSAADPSNETTAAAHGEAETAPTAKGAGTGTAPAPGATPEPAQVVAFTKLAEGLTAVLNELKEQGGDADRFYTENRQLGEKLLMAHADEREILLRFTRMRPALVGSF